MKIHTQGVKNACSLVICKLQIKNLMFETCSSFFSRISETEFMEFADIDNHDDFYTVDEGRVHVQDQRGYYIIYDVALEDLK